MTYIETQRNDVYYIPLLFIYHHCNVRDFTLNFYQKYFHLPSLLLVIITSTLVVGCSSKSTTKKPSTSPTTHVPQKNTHVLSAKQRIENAQYLSIEQATIELISASEQLLNEQQYHQATWLAHQLLVTTNLPKQQFKLLIIKAQGLFALTQYQQAYTTLATIEELQNEHSLKPSLPFLTLKEAVLAQRQQTIDSIDIQLRAFAKNTNLNDDDINRLWQRLSGLSSWQVEQLALRQPPNFKGWQQLLNFSFKFADEHDKFQRYLAQWQRNYPTHPGNKIANMLQAIPSSLNVNNIENIAVILPLSGKQERAGKVAQQGVLAAFNNNEAQSLHFIDSDKLDMSLVSEQLIALNIDYVIGPLLRENVDTYTALEDLTVPTLLLNIPSNNQLKPHQIAFSMRPEDEAIQAATTLSNKAFKYPLLLSHKDNVSQRITQTFSNTWHSLTDAHPNIVYFDQGKNMQNTLKSSLEVSKSQQRINQIKSRAKQTIKDEPRNRRDIDMIYLVGSVAQTRLLKPYIDVNISPFAKRIPVFSSSRSHSAQSDASDSRDLAGLVFTEMPWLLSSKQQNTALHQLSNKLWPNRSDGLQRIFAMGYDSFNILTKLDKMQRFKYVRHFGQTGVLQLTNNNILSRSLLWGKYSNDKAEEIAKDNK